MMPQGEEYYLGPIEHGYYRYTDLIDGTLDLADVAECNDAMAFRAENQRRAQAALDRK